MSFKIGLLGSAVAMFAVGNVNAQSVVVAEPERADYVRVCDAYGSGFFFVPGTETCMRLGGFVRSSYEQINFENRFEFTFESTFPGLFFIGPSVFTSTFESTSEANLWAQQAQLNIDVRNETEWGTLRSLYRLEAGQGNVDADIDMDVALISLAGFRAGYAGANYWSSNHNFGSIDVEPSFVLDRLDASPESVLPVDGFYGFNAGTIFDYTWAQDGLSVTVGLEDPRLFDGDSSNSTNNGFPAPITFFNNDRSTDDSVNFYAGFNYSMQNVEVAFTAVRDALAFHPVNFDEGGWAYKASVHVDLSEIVPDTSVAGYYMADGNYETDYVHAYDLIDNPDSIWGVVLNTALSDELDLWVNYWNAEGDEVFPLTDFFTGFPFGQITNSSELRMFGVGLNWYPTAAPGFSVKGAYINGEIENITTFEDTFFTTTSKEKTDFDGFRVTVRRDF